MSLKNDLLTILHIRVISWNIRRGEIQPNLMYGLNLVDLGNGESSSHVSLLFESWSAI